VLAAFVLPATSAQAASRRPKVFGRSFTPFTMGELLRAFLGKIDFRFSPALLDNATHLACFANMQYVSKSD
jgi:hypothetical protein